MSIDKKEYMKLWREKNKDRLREYNREYAKTHHDEIIARVRSRRDPQKVHEYNLRYNSEHKDELREKRKIYKVKNRERILEYRKQYYRKNRERYKEYYEIMQAVRDAKLHGILEEKPCEWCGCEKVEAHHKDYSKPLEVMWLCNRCHRKWHEQNIPKGEVYGEKK